MKSRKASRTARAFFKAPRSLEKDEQKHGIRFLLSLGAAVYVSGTKRVRPNPSCEACKRNQSTRQSPGIPDVEAFIPDRKRCDGSLIQLKWEAKASSGGRASPEQLLYEERARRAGIHYVRGGYAALLQWAVAHGLARETQIPHYRLETEGGRS